VARDPRQAVLWRAAVALFAYASAVACRTVAPHVDALPLEGAAQVLFCVPALAWAGATVALLPTGRRQRRHMDLGWLLTSGILLLMVPALPPTGRLVVLAPLVGALVLLWRFHDAVRPRVLAAPLTAAAALYGVGLAAVCIPLDLGSPWLVIAAIGLDLAVLGFLIAAADAMDAGERLRPDLRRSGLAALGAAVAFGGPAVLTMLAADTQPVVLALQFTVVAAAMTAVGSAGMIRRALDRLAFADAERLRLDRTALLLVVDALPRRPERHRLIAVSEAEFVRLTSRALESFGDLGRLLRSPLIDLPVVERRVAGRGSSPDQPLARAVELRAVLRHTIDRLKPPGVFGTTEEWRLYNALHVGYVLGVQPYGRRVPTDGLDRDARRALDWLRHYVPEEHLHRWQAEGTRHIAAELWTELIATDPAWLTRNIRPARPATRGTETPFNPQNG
jgi:hypothetical protein